MIRKTIGLALLTLAVLAFILTSVTGSPTAAFDPFDPVAYYRYIPVELGLQYALPATGEPGTLLGGDGIPDWLIPALAGTGVALVVGYVVMRLRLRRS